MRLGSPSAHTQCTQALEIARHKTNNVKTVFQIGKSRSSNKLG